MADVYFIARADLPADAAGRFATVFGPFPSEAAAVEAVRNFKAGHDYHLFSGALTRVVHVTPAPPALPAPATPDDSQ